MYAYTIFNLRIDFCSFSEIRVFLLSRGMSVLSIYSIYLFICLNQLINQLLLLPSVSSLWWKFCKRINEYTSKLNQLSHHRLEAPLRRRAVPSHVNTSNFVKRFSRFF